MKKIIFGIITFILLGISSTNASFDVGVTDLGNGIQIDYQIGTISVIDNGSIIYSRANSWLDGKTIDKIALVYRNSKSTIQLHVISGDEVRKFQNASSTTSYNQPGIRYFYKPLDGVYTGDSTPDKYGYVKFDAGNTWGGSKYGTPPVEGAIELLDGFLYRDTHYQVNSIPDNAICSTDLIQFYGLNLHKFGTGTVIDQKEEELYLIDGSNSIGFTNSKSFSGQLYDLINGNGEFGLKRPFWEYGYPTLRANFSDGIDYFKMNVTGHFQGSNLDGIPLERYKVHLCSGQELKNPQFNINYPNYTLTNPIYFFSGNEYSLPQKYTCLDFIFPIGLYKDLNFQSLSLGVQSEGELKETEVCYIPDTTEIYVDGETFSGSLNDIGKNGTEITNTIDWTGDLISLGSDTNFDLNNDGKISIEESSSGILNYIKEFFSNLSKMVSRIKVLLNEIGKLGDDVEKKDFLSFFIPSANATNSIVDGTLNNLSKENMDQYPVLKNSYILWYSFVFFVTFLALFGILYKLRN